MQLWNQVSPYMLEFWSHIWRLLSVELPYIGLTFGQLLIGNFIVLTSIRIFKTYFGLPSLSAPKGNKVEKRYERKNKNDEIAYR